MPAILNYLLHLATAVALVMGFFVVYTRVIALDWDRFDRVYRAIETVLVRESARPDAAIMVVDPPAYYTANGRAAVVVPAEDTATVLALAESFGADYLVLESRFLRTPSLEHLYANPTSDPSFVYLGQVEDAQIFRIDR